MYSCPTLWLRLSNSMALFGTRKVLGKGKKNAKENDFLMFGFMVENIKKSNIIKILQNFTSFEFLSPCIIERNI